MAPGMQSELLEYMFMRSLNGATIMCFPQAPNYTTPTTFTTHMHTHTHISTCTYTSSHIADFYIPSHRHTLCAPSIYTPYMPMRTQRDGSVCTSKTTFHTHTHTHTHCEGAAKGIKGKRSNTGWTRKHHVRPAEPKERSQPMN